MTRSTHSIISHTRRTSGSGNQLSVSVHRDMIMIRGTRSSRNIPRSAIVHSPLSFPSTGHTRTIKHTLTTL